MTPETETAPHCAGSNGGDGSEAKTTRDSDTMSKSSERNGVQGCGRGGHTGRVSHQGRGR